MTQGLKSELFGALRGMLERGSLVLPRDAEDLRRELTLHGRAAEQRGGPAALPARPGGGAPGHRAPIS